MGIYPVVGHFNEEAWLQDQKERRASEQPDDQAVQQESPDPEAASRLWRLICEAAGEYRPVSEQEQNKAVDALNSYAESIKGHGL